MTKLTDPIFNNEDAARAHFEAIRWPDGRVCPHCGSVGNSTLLKGKSTRPGLYKCKDCRKPFTATMGTVYERSHIPLHKWLLATHLMVSSKKGISAHQLYRMLGFGSYRTAWFMAHRIREAMRSNDLSPMGSGGGVVEVDETYIGNSKKQGNFRGGYQHKMKVVSLVDRGSGSARSVHVDRVSADTVLPIVRSNIAREARVMTDAYAVYRRIIPENFAQHGVIRHEFNHYVDGEIHTNTVEGFFSIFKRGMRGIYQHCAEKHLHRYLAEFDFRYTNRAARGVDDAARAVIALQGTVGRRLTYERPHGRAAH
jgi:transposase-like protein